jgi:molybdate transport system substrate-binding protein
LLMTRRPVQIILVLCCVLISAACGAKSQLNVPLIFAAASLSNVLVESAEVYERETGNRIEFSFGGSIALANQIAKLGAPADGVFVVGREAIERIADADLVGSNGHTAMLFNQLAVIGSSDAEMLDDLPSLLGTEGRIAIGDPDLAPVGSFSRQALESAGIWDEITDRLILTSDVRAASTAVTTGNAKFAVVYTSDVASINNSSFNKLLTIENGYDSINYYFVPIKDADNSESAADFFTFLAGSAETKRIFNEAGFRWNVHAGLPSGPLSPER